MSKRILLVDDCPEIRGAVRLLFESAGFDVCGEAGDGARAVEQAAILRPDLIVLDLAMPVMNGLQAAPLLRKLLPAVSIILFTLYAGPLVEGQAIELGINAVIAKDEGIATLLSQANALFKLAHIGG